MELAHDVVIADKYVLLEPLGSGAFGDVWVAKQTAFDRRVALKFLKVQGDAARRRFSLEAKALARLDHPNCVQVHDFGVFQGTPYLVTGFVSGETLDHWLAGRPPLREIQSVARSLAAALEHAHGEQIVHRDVKPANIMVSEDSDGLRPVLLDFGVAKLAGPEQTDVTKTGELIGTPGYMSPEQLRAGSIGPPADVYSFGAVLYLMFAGEPPFRARTQLDLAMQHLTEAAPPLETVSAPIADCILRMLEKDPKARPSMREVRRVLHGKQKRPRKRQADKQLAAAGERGKRSVWRTVGIVAAPILLLAGLAWTLSQGKETTTPPPLAPRDGTALIRPADGGLAPDVPGGSDAIAQDADAEPDAGPDCDIRPGVHEFQTPGGQFSMRVPGTYDTGTPAPVLLMLHDVLQPPSDLLEIEQLNELADREGYVILAPDDNDVSETWLAQHDVRRVLDALDVAAAHACLDMDRLYVIGHGNGGIAAQEIACRVPVVAMAHTSHRMADGVGRPCDGTEQVPTIAISMMDDPTNPITADPDCLGHLKWSLEHHERVMREAHGCVDDYDGDGATCQDLDCRVPLRLCRPAGGRDWRAMRQRFVTNNPVVCNSPPGGFDFVREIWAFFHAR